MENIPVKSVGVRCIKCKRDFKISLPDLLAGEHLLCPICEDAVSTSGDCGNVSNKPSGQPASSQSFVRTLDK
jgi:hypothetical protein